MFLGICIFVLVLMGWSLLPSALRPFKIYRAPPNLGRLLLGRECADYILLRGLIFRPKVL